MARKASLRFDKRAYTRVRSLLASAQAKVPGDSSTDILRVSVEGDWQRRAWSYYDEVGELHYAATFMGNALSRCRLTVALVDSDGTPGPAFDEDGTPLPGAEGAVEALALLRELQAPVGGQSQLLKLFGKNLFITGESWLLGIDDAEAGRRTWEVLSTEELKPQGTDGYRRIIGPGQQPQSLPADAHIVRVWEPHGRYVYAADSSVRGVLDVLEELVLLTREVRAEALSRLAAAGVMLVPSELEYEGDESDDADGSGDPFTRDLIETMATAISDKSSAAQTVPFVLRGQAEYLDKVRHLRFDRGTLSDSTAKRAEAVLRLARGIDLPVEVLLGHAQTTFSNAWQIDESLFKAHIEPKLELVCDALTLGYLQPNLPGTQLVVYYDATELVTHPNRGVDAKDAHDRFVVSDATYRSAVGFSEGDAPDDEEVKRRLEILQAKNVRERIESTPQQVDVIDPNQPGPVTGGESGVQAALEVSVERAVRRVGSRVRSQLEKDPAARTLLAGVGSADVVRTVGAERASQLLGTTGLALNGEFDALEVWANTHGTDGTALRRMAEDLTRQRLGLT